MDILGSEEASDSADSPPKRRGTRRSLRSNANRSNTAAPARRQPRRIAAVKGSLAESPSNSSGINSEQSEGEESASDDDDDAQQENCRSKRRIGQDAKADKAGVKRQKALVTEDDSDDSMLEAGGSKEDVQVISDSEDQSDEESDKENQPSRRQTRFSSCH